MKRPQATRATPAQVHLHIQRQKALGERMIRESDKPRPIELIASGAAVVLIICLG